MVASASSSNTQWPSGCCCSSSARCRLDAPLERGSRRLARRMSIGERWRVHADVLRITRPRFRSAARLPERIAPSMVAGNPVSVQSPARTRLSHAVAAPGACAFCSGVAAKVARRSRTICHGGSGAGRPATAATSFQIALRQALARHVQQPVAAADGDRQAAGKREQPFDGAVDDADHGREAGRRIDAEMRVDDGAELGRHLRPGTSVSAAIAAAPPGPPRRRRRARPPRCRNRAPRPRSANRCARSRAELDRRARCAAGSAIAGSTKASPTGRRGDQRPAGASAGRQRLADDRAGEAARLRRRIGVERRQQQRLRSRS